jgi:hypothetical protein
MADATVNNIASGLESAINQAVQNAVNNQGQGQQTTKTSDQVNISQKQTSTITDSSLSQQAVETPRGATPTDASSVEAPIAKTGNMQTGEYVNPYQAEQQQMIQQLGGAKLYETPQETKDFIKGVFASQTEKYDYAAEKDPLVAAAKQNVTKVITDMAAKRGFAFGSGTQDMISQQMAKVLPQFEQIARGEHADFLSRQLGLVNQMMQWEQIQFDRSKDQVQLLTQKMDAINKMSDRDFNIFKTMMEQRNNNRQIYLQQQKFDLDKKIQENQMALNRIEQLGYVDEDASIILGVPVGTKAKWVQQMAIEQANKLELMAKENDYSLKKMVIDSQMERELYTLKSQIDLNSQLRIQAMIYEYKKSLQNIELARDVELQRMAAEAAAAKGSGGGGGGGRKGSSGSSSAKSAYGLTDAELNKEYTKAIKVFKGRMKQLNSAGGAELRSVLANMTNEGYSPEVIARIRIEYDL